MTIQAKPEEQKIIDHLKSEGYDKVWIYEAPAEEIDEEHKHEYDTRLHILSGEIRIKLLDESVITDFRLGKNEELDIPRNHLHSAKVGLEGCRYIVAEKH